MRAHILTGKKTTVVKSVCNLFMQVLRLFLLISLATIIPGQIIRIPLSPAQAITLSDISIAITVICFLIYSFFNKTKLLIPKKIFFSFLIFTTLAFASTILALSTLSFIKILSSLLFLIRFVAYFSVALIAFNIIEKKEISNWLNSILSLGLIFALLGFIQIVFLPDLSFLTIFGWDPHINRLASTVIDPNFTGVILVFFFTISTTLYLFKKRYIYLALSLIFFIAIFLTFSRSSYLAFLTSIVVLGTIKSPRIIFLFLLIFTTAILLIPKARTRVAGAFTLDETATARIESWQNAYTIFRKNWLFGIGFNTFRYIQETQGNFTFDSPQGNHSGSGTDSSLLLVALTTGILGLLSFVLFLFFILKSFAKNTRSKYIKTTGVSSFIALLVHSQFVNSFFFPQVMIIIWFLIGLSFVDEK